MANSKDYKDVGLNNDKNQNVSGSSPSSDFDRLEDCNEAEFRGATLSLSQETSPPESIAASVCDDPNGNVEADGSVGKRQSSTARAPHSSSIQDFFAVREGALQKAAEQCRPVLLERIDGELRGIWLLTDPLILPLLEDFLLCSALSLQNRSSFQSYLNFQKQPEIIRIYAVIVVNVSPKRWTCTYSSLEISCEQATIFLYQIVLLTTAAFQVAFQKAGHSTLMCGCF
ncbi:uncharacterized protein TNCV_1400511 [Trichonephila clavipes]|nr:uncharacterized protein TNCV_1400511 [Trichonephila clavipes]